MDTTQSTNENEAGGKRSRLYVYNGGFLTQRRVRRILQLKGYDLRLGLPGPQDRVGVWGQSPTSKRGEAIANRRDVPIVRIEDAFIRSLHPGRKGEPPVGLIIDHNGVHFDPSAPSDLEQLLATHPLDDTALLDRARNAIEYMRETHLSKYCATDTQIDAPNPGYVLVIDQTRGDAAVSASGATEAMFREMLVFAQEEHPGARVVIKAHPETNSGFRPGYFGEGDVNHRVSLTSDPISPWTLMEGAVGVYTVSSQLGFEAILAGHKPRVFGQPFYAGWGLTQDENPIARRQRSLTRAQLFAAAMILYPTWYDPYNDTSCDLETVLYGMASRARAWREDRHGWCAGGMRLWKRPTIQRFFGHEKHMVFSRNDAKPAPQDRRCMIWATKVPTDNRDIVRVEDGFLRSRGLGAQLTPPLSLVTDTQGIYYDPTHPSDLEAWIGNRETLTRGQDRRAERLIAELTSHGLSKYNVGQTYTELPTGHRVLVPGQVEDDASILKGAGKVRTNLDLLKAVRSARPNAIIIYKPHPDVEAGLRKGGIDQERLEALADYVATNTDAATLLAQVNEVWTITSLMGFEALLRGLPVTTLGMPFYAGWDLTHDMETAPERRKARPSLHGLVHAVLIDYPRYVDPITGLPCPVEIVLKRLAENTVPSPGPTNRFLSKLQGVLASYSHMWR